MAEAEGAFQALERSGFSYKRLFLFRKEDPSSLNDPRRHLRKCIAASLLLGGLIGSWAGRPLFLIPPFLRLFGGGQATARGLATLEVALIAGGLGALGAILYRTLVRRFGDNRRTEVVPSAPFRIDVRGTPEEASRAHAVLEKERETRTAA
jgi:hypothetical protein